MALADERRNIQAHMNRTGGTYSRHRHGGNCHVCGASAIYTVLFYHEPSNSYIRTGNDCAQKLDMAYSEGDMEAFRTAIKGALELKAGKRKAEATLAELDLSAAWQLFMIGGRRHSTGRYLDECLAVRDTWKDGNEERSIVDMVERLIQYGSLSEKQYGFMRTLLERIPRREQIAAERAAEKEAAKPAPKGRAKVSGTVLKVDVYESAFGSTTKMLVKADEGFMVFCSRPAGLNCERGDHVTFVATLTPKEDDPKFAWGSRPKAA